MATLTFNVTDELYSRLLKIGVKQNEGKSRGALKLAGTKAVEDYVKKHEVDAR